MLAPNGTVYVDNSTLRAVAECDTRGVLRHVLGYTVQEEAHALEVGTAAHEVLADYLGGKPAAYCTRKFGLLYQPYSDLHVLGRLDSPSAPNPYYRLSYENVSLILNEWFETHSLASFPFLVNPKMIEVGFEIPLDDECVCGHSESAHRPGCQWRGKCGCTDYRPAFVMWGRLDAIVQANHDRSLYVLDHKTTGRLTPYWTEKFRNDSQMTGYVWAAQRTLGQHIVGVFINAIELSKLPSDPVRKCTRHGVTYSECGPRHTKAELLIYTRTPEQLEQWRLTALSLARRYRELLKTPHIEALPDVRMQGTFTGACGFCEFNKFCQAGRPTEYAGSMLVHQPWRPYTKEEVKNAS
jgi:PD-(D/E)XK nuclease superfamily protein